MLTCETLLAQAADAEREARTLWTKIDAARGGSDALIPAGCERDVERASDLMRRARALTAEADEMRAEAIPVAATVPTSTVEPRLTLPTPSAVEEPAETAETVAARILNSDSAAPDTRLVTSAPNQPGAADAVETVVARILEA